MRKLNLLILIVILLSTHSFADRLLSGYVSIQHVSGFNYELRLIRFVEDPFIVPPVSLLRASPRDTTTQTQVASFTLPIVSNSVLPPNIIACGVQKPPIHELVYSDTVLLDSAIFNEQAGYLFRWTGCCRGPGTQNVAFSQNEGYSIVTLFPPVVDANGNQIINNTPELQTNVSDVACFQHPFYQDYGGYDEDGDSLEFVIYTPFNDLGLQHGTYIGQFLPYPDPSTKFPRITWEQGFDSANQIHGVPPSTQNRITIDSNTGEATMIPDVAPGYYLFGVWCREYRNGILIGSVFRDFEITVDTNCITSPNTAPNILAPVFDSITTLDFDTIVFGSSSVCLGINVADSDPISDIELEFFTERFESSEVSLSPDTGTIMNPNIFSTQLCFQTDSFTGETFSGTLIVRNNGCYDLKTDTVNYWFRFDGLSNAGIGGDFDVLIDTISAAIPLFGFLSGDPNPGGTWFTLDSTLGWIAYPNQIPALSITDPTYLQFRYIQKSPNYPADTTFVNVNFIETMDLAGDVDDNIKIYPNPSSGRINIIANEWQLGQTYYIYNAQMQLVKKGIFESQHNQIDLDRHGIFYLIINSRNTITKKFIIH